MGTRRCCWLAALLLVGVWGVALAQDDSPAAEPAAEAPQDDGAIAVFDGDPNDPKAVREYAGAQFQKIVASLQTDADLAEKQADALAKIVAAWKVENAESQQLVTQINATVALVRERAALARVSIDELKQKLDAAPDAKTVQDFVSKIAQTLAPLTSTDVAAAEKQLADARDYLSALSDKSEDEAVKQAIERSQRMFDNLASRIEAEKRLAELIGKDAAPLDIATWVNGGPLTSDDLKGKVVLLDFWAVWCGPCIMTFPQLREWHEQYHEKGLEIIGVTGYYKFKWDDAADKAVAARGEDVSHEDEQAMLVKFAEQHKLAHPFAVTAADDLSKFYGVTGIPHVVLIDRAGKIRLIKVGAGPTNAKEIGTMIETLIAE